MKDFEQYPVWVWDDANEGYLPISNGKYTREYSPLFIEAQFFTSGYVFEGYLVEENPSYCFFIFIGVESIGFNLNMTLKSSEIGLKNVFRILGCNPFPFFPLRYESKVTFEDGEKISGVFEIKDGELRCIPDGHEERQKKTGKVSKKHMKTINDETRAVDILK
jgi:hypothetical protein